MITGNLATDTAAPAHPMIIMNSAEPPLHRVLRVAIIEDSRNIRERLVQLV